MPDSQGDWLREQVEAQLQSEWEDYKEIYANSKGATYEESLSAFLTSYFGGVYDINTRGAVIDPELKCFDVFDFKTGNDEVDVVASFVNSKPRVVFETGEGAGTLRWIPYEGVAALFEVKSSLRKQALIEDLEKLSSLRKLDDIISDRFGVTVSGNHTVQHPIKCLVYNSESISNNTLKDVLSDYKDCWDMVLIVENDTLILNSSLPFSEVFTPSTKEYLVNGGLSPHEAEQIIKSYEENPDVGDGEGLNIAIDMVSVDEGLSWFLITLSASIPDPLSVNTSNSLISLLNNRIYYTGAKTDIDEDSLE